MANQKVDKKVETLTYCLLSVACSLKSSKIFVTNKIGLLYIEIDGRVWFSFKDISDILKKPSLYRREDVIIIDDIQYMSSVELQRMLQKNSSAIAKELYTRLGFSLPKYVESVSKDILNVQAAFIDFPSIINYEINPYRIQLYFPSLQIAVESDKDLYVNKGYSLERREAISSKTGCLFLCFNADFEGLLVGDVIRQLRMITNLHNINLFEQN